MNDNTRFALEIYNTLQKLKEKNEIKTYQFIIDNMGNSLKLTEVELQGTPKHFQKFIIDNGFLVKSIDKYKVTEALEDFNYNLERLQTHLKYSKVSLEYIQYVAESSFDDITQELGYEKNEIDWDDFLSQLNETRKNIIYEHSLINLITLFESYISDIIKWVYKNNPDAQEKLKVNLTYGEVLKNLSNLLEIVLSNQFSNFQNWSSRNKELKSNINLDWKKLKESEIIDEAIARRNIIVHNKGRIDTFYYSKYPDNGSLDERLNIEVKYYNKIEKAVIEVVTKIDEIVRSKL